MDRFNEIVGKAGKIVRRWWLGLVLGVLLVVAGIVVFCNPVESYMALSVMFGVLMLLSGITELAVALGSRNFFMMRGYSIVGAILDLLLGIFLCVYPQVTLVVLPVVIGIWLLWHSFMVIGFGGDLSTFRLPGSGWTIFGGVMMLILGLMMVIMPLTVGVAALAFVTGCAMIVAGAMAIALSLKLRQLHDNVQTRYPGPDYGD